MLHHTSDIVKKKMRLNERGQFLEKWDSPNQSEMALLGQSRFFPATPYAKQPAITYTTELLPFLNLRRTLINIHS